jgi:tartrate-resistant acid phosphatase type 5
MRVQLDARLAGRDWRWHCERFFSLALGGGDVELFFIDTSPGVASYAEAPWAVNAGAAALADVISRISPLQERPPALLQAAPMQARLR